MNTFKHQQLRCNCTHSWGADYKKYGEDIGINSYHLMVKGPNCKKCGYDKWVFGEKKK